MTDIPWTGTSDGFDAMWEDEEPETVPDMLETMFKARLIQPISAVIPCDPELYGKVEKAQVRALIKELTVHTQEALYTVAGCETRLEAQDALGNLWKRFLDLHIALGLDGEDVFRQFFLTALVERLKR